MSKKANSKKPKKTKPEQLKIPNTGRKDAIPEIETQAEKYRAARDSRMEMQADEDAEQEALTDVLTKHGKSEYFYDDSEGVRRRAYIPKVAGAKVQKVKPKNDAKASE